MSRQVRILVDIMFEPKLNEDESTVQKVAAALAAEYRDVPFEPDAFAQDVKEGTVPTVKVMVYEVDVQNGIPITITEYDGLPEDFKLEPAPLSPLKTEAQVDMELTTKLELDRNARAYGWEIGNGAPLKSRIPHSDNNPFLDKDWRDKVEYVGDLD